MPRHSQRSTTPRSPRSPGRQPSTRVLGLLAPGRPPPLSLPSLVLAPPGPAPNTHLRRLRAGRTAASQLRAESTREEQGKKGLRLQRAE
jgi:hypothetical protein